MNYSDFIPEAVIGLASAFTGWFFTRKKQHSETEAIDIDNDGKELDNVEQAIAIWRKMASDLRDEIKLLNRSIEHLSKENHELKLELAKLKKLIVEMS